MVMSFLKRNIWWILIGFIGSLFFCYISYFIWKMSLSNGILVLLEISYPVFFVIALLSEFENKSGNAESVGGKAFLLSVWEFFLYLFVFWIIMLRPHISEEGSGVLVVLYPLMFLVISFIPMSFAGGFLVYGIRKIREGKKQKN